MTEESANRNERCLWHASDGRCASCKARRIRLDVFHFKDYDMCRGAEDYVVCEFYKKKPAPPGGQR